MSQMNKKENNLYELICGFDLSPRIKCVESCDFTTKDIPTCKFNIFAQITDDCKGIDVQIRKSDIRPAIAVIKVQAAEQKPIITRVVNWTKNVDFSNFILSFAFDTCLRSQIKGYNCRLSCHSFHMTVHCSIFWHGFVEDLYYSDVCHHVHDWDNTEFSDLKIKVGNCEILAHKKILAQQSPVFHKMLTSEIKEAKENIISFPDADVDTIKGMILFFYKNKLNLAEKDKGLLLKLFKFAVMYQIDKLKTACEYILIKNLKIDNALDLCAVGKDCNSLIVQQHASAFLINNAFGKIEVPTLIQVEDNGLTLFNGKIKLANLRSQNFESSSVSKTEIPHSAFNIVVKKNDYCNLDVLIKKNDTRAAVAVIKIQVENQKPIIEFVLDWRKSVDIKNILIPLDPKRFEILSLFQNCKGFDYEFKINCSIIWKGFVEDMYNLNGCQLVENYYNNTEFSDLKIKVGDCEFSAHKNILAKHSPVFRKMLTSDMKEAKEDVISFPDADVDTIKEMLMFFYERKLDKAEREEEIALKLFKFAVMYQIEKLITACEYILMKNLKINGIFNLYRIGKEYNSTTLAQYALIFFENKKFELFDKMIEGIEKVVV